MTEVKRYYMTAQNFDAAWQAGQDPRQVTVTVVLASAYDALLAELHEQARLNGMGSEREAALQARIVGLERWQSAALSWLRADDSPSALALRRDADDPMLAALHPNKRGGAT